LKKSVFLLAHNRLSSPRGKTCHALIRTSARYDVLAIIDPKLADKDTSAVILDKHVIKPIFSSVKQAIQKLKCKVDYSIVSVATKGGKLPTEMIDDLEYSLKNGISIINGLHDKVQNIPNLNQLAKHNALEIIELKNQKDNDNQHFWSGRIMQCKTPIISVIGTDCAQGKRTTATLLTEFLNKPKLKTELIYTGQTGYLQGIGKHGFILDATLNDFVAGELERAILNCCAIEKPDLILIEGQSSPLNPLSPESSVFILSANARGVIIQHTPNRKYHIGFEEEKIEIASLEKTIKNIKSFDTEIVGITINPENMDSEELKNYITSTEKKFNIPCFNPIVGIPNHFTKRIEQLIQS